MLEPIEKEINGKTFILSKFPAVAGREIVAKYPLSGMPKLGDYEVNEATMLKLMAFVGVPREGAPLMLTTRALVDNHCGDWETLAKVEVAMMEYNVSFFGNGRASSFLQGIAQKLPALATKILTDSLQQLSAKTKQP
jgi:hypothetical protein